MVTSPVLVPISKDGKITIPKELLKALKWENCEQMIIKKVKQGILIELDTQQTKRKK